VQKFFGGAVYVSYGVLMFDDVAISDTWAVVRPLWLVARAARGGLCRVQNGGAVAMDGGTVTFRRGCLITRTSAVRFAERAHAHQQSLTDLKVMSTHT
jgi:hypothetical protein